MYAARRLERTLSHLNPSPTAASWSMEEKPVKVVVTGAAGQIAYALLPQIAGGAMLGPRSIELVLVDLPMMMEKCNGVIMELRDCAFPLLKKVSATGDLSIGFKNADVVIQVGAFPRRQGMLRKDLLRKNAAIFKEQGAALNKYASRDVKVLVVGNPANTNALLCMTHAPDLPRTNFSALTRLDMNRAKGQIAKRLGVGVGTVSNVIIWGNHSKTQYPDVRYATVADYPKPGMVSGVEAAIGDQAWLRSDFIHIVQHRGAAIIKARKFSSAASAANAIVNHVQSWLLGTGEGEIVSMGVVSDGSYGVPAGLIYSFPVTCKDGEYSIVQGLKIDEFSAKLMEATATELAEEKKEAFEFLGL